MVDIMTYDVKIYLILVAFVCWVFMVEYTYGVRKIFPFTLFIITLTIFLLFFDDIFLAGG
jgi:hypothetical protein